ncbi:Ankyrin repeat-containing protein, partial [Oryctes borbonicus]
MSHCEEQHSHDKCQINSTASNVFQTLDELDFERRIWSAAQSGDLHRVADLIEKGENVNVKDAAGYTALHYAARNGHLDICKYLLVRNSDVNAVTKAGLATSLHRACSSGWYDIVKILLDFKADVNLQDADGKTALHRAAEAQNRAICEHLLAISPELKFV